jgi:PRTRC genetic system protein E
MNFFQQIFDLMDGIDVTITMKRKNGKLTMSVLPQTAAVISPALITGTPQELEEGFFNAIRVPMDTAKGLKAELEQFNQSVDNAKNVKALAESDKQINKDHADKRAADKKKGPVKPATKKNDKPQLIEASLFDTPVDPADEITDAEVDEMLTKESLVPAADTIEGDQSDDEEEDETQDAV